MAASDDRELIHRMLTHLRDGLQPVVERVLAPLTPPGRSWTALLDERDRIAGRAGRYDPNDLQSMLVAMTGRLGSAGFPFDGLLGTRALSSLPQELRSVRNDWAHMKPFSPDDTDRALDSGMRLLRAVGAPDAETVEQMLTAHRRQRYAAPSEQPEAATRPSSSLPPVTLTVPPNFGSPAEPAVDGAAPAAPMMTAAPSSTSTATVRITAETLTTLSSAPAKLSLSPAMPIGSGPYGINSCKS